MHLPQNIGTYQRIVLANQQQNSSLRLAHAPVYAYDEMYAALLCGNGMHLLKSIGTYERIVSTKQKKDSTPALYDAPVHVRTCSCI